MSILKNTPSKAKSGVLPTRGVTGTHERMKILPLAPIDYYYEQNTQAGAYSDEPDAAFNNQLKNGGEPFGEEVSREFSNSDSRRGLVKARTVYEYRDRYKFSRLVVDDCLIFDSHFESGNLLSAKRIYNEEKPDRLYQEYDLKLHHDVHCKNGLSQWFYFSASSNCSFPSQNVKIKFNIINFSKPDSLYNYGMKPLHCSSNDGSWKRIGDKIRYFPTKLQDCQQNREGKKYYTLSFVFYMNRSDDVHYFAAAFPYTYNHLQQYLYKLELDRARAVYLHRELLCETVSGNRCDLLTITEPSSYEYKVRTMREKRVVVITARVHPGETNASWICQGIIDFITGMSLEAQDLRSRYVFKIIPMLNPDGVVNGNYRTSMSGVDLNRCWDAPNALSHPTIYRAKKMINKLKNNRKVELVCDIHGHSRKEGAFVYGCIPTHQLTCEDHENYIFPRVLDRKSEFFVFDSCDFHPSSNKSSTMRMVMFEMGLKSYTLEASMSGFKGKHFSTFDLMKLGHHLCQSVLELSSGFIVQVGSSHKILPFVPSVQSQQKRPPLLVANKEVSIPKRDIRSDKKDAVPLHHDSSDLDTNFGACKHPNKCKARSKNVGRNLPTPQLPHQRSRHSRYIFAKQTVDESITEVGDGREFCISSSRHPLKVERRCVSPLFVWAAKSKANNLYNPKNFLYSSISSRNQQHPGRKAPSIYDFQVVNLNEKRDCIAKGKYLHSLTHAKNLHKC